MSLITLLVASMAVVSVETKECADNSTFLSPSLKIVGHTHLVRGKVENEDYVFGRLKKWAEDFGVDACGIGSPWSEKNRRATYYNEREFRDQYFAGRKDGAQVFDPAEVEAMIDRANRESGGKTLYYVDNETPKSYYGHLWHVVFKITVPNWHDYNQDRAVWYSPLDDETAEINQVTKKPHRRRTYREVVAEQRKAGALCIWAHPTSWWTKDGKPDGPFVTNIAAEMLPELLIDGYLDGMTVQGYDAFHRDYQGLWFALLDRGYRVPGYSETDLSIVHNITSADCGFFNCLQRTGEKFNLDWIKREFKAARHTMSNGIELFMTVNGALQGSELKVEGCADYEVEVKVFPAKGEKKVSRVELLGRGGIVLGSVCDFKGGTVKWRVRDEKGDGGYLLARAFGENDGDYLYKAQQRIKYCAITNPVWIRTPRFQAPKPIVPKMDHMANPKVRELMDYIAKGHFRKDFKGCVPGVVPVEAWRIDEMIDAL
jgi:hypothetical protein